MRSKATFSLLCSLLSILRKRRFERREKNEKVKSEEYQKEMTIFFRKSSSYNSCFAQQSHLFSSLSSLIYSLETTIERREKNEKVKSEEYQKETTIFFRKSSFLFGAPGGIRTALSRFHPLPLFFTPSRKSAGILLRKIARGFSPSQTKKTGRRKSGILFFGAPGGIRTPDLLIRSQTLYPTELRARVL